MGSRGPLGNECKEHRASAQIVPEHRGQEGLLVGSDRQRRALKLSSTCELAERRERHLPARPIHTCRQGGLVITMTPWLPEALPCRRTVAGEVVSE